MSAFVIVIDQDHTHAACDWLAAHDLVEHDIDFDEGQTFITTAAPDSAKVIAQMRAELRVPVSLGSLID